MIDIYSLIKFTEPNQYDFQTKIFILGYDRDYEMVLDMGKMHGYKKVADMLYYPLKRYSGVYDFMIDTYPDMRFLKDWKNGDIQRKFAVYCIKHICKEEI